MTDFEFLAVYNDFVFITLKSKHLRTMTLLQTYPYLCMHSKVTYCYQMPCNHTPFFEILRELWKLHAGFKRIEIMKHNITIKRLAPKRLSDLCLRIIDENSMNHLPAHVSKRLKIRRVIIREFGNSKMNKNLE